MTEYTELQKAAAYAAQDTIKFSDEDEEMRALQQFHEEVSPETVLALIADLDEARNGMKHSCAIRLKKQIEQLEKERDQLKAENERLVEDYDKAWRHDLNDKNNIQALAAEVARLSAENEALASSRAKLAGELSRLRAKHKDWSVSAALGQGEQS